MLGSSRAGEVFDALKRNFDLLIIDSPPVLPVADALVLSRVADATVIIANARRTRRDDLQRSFESLQQAGAHVVGTVLNQASGASLYGYGYGYSYGQESDGAFGGFLRRRPGYAPKRSGTQVLERSELPKFEAARATKRLGDESGRGGESAASSPVPQRSRPAPCCQSVDDRCRWPRRFARARYELGHSYGAIGRRRS